MSALRHSCCLVPAPCLNDVALPAVRIFLGFPTSIQYLFTKKDPMFKRFITWFLENVRPAPPPRNRPVPTPRQPAGPRDVGQMGASSPCEKANKISANRGSTEAVETKRPPSSDSEATPVDGRRRYSIWPQKNDRKETDRIYGELVVIFGADGIQQTGGRGGSAHVAFWQVRATDDEITRLRELEPLDVSEIGPYRQGSS